VNISKYRKPHFIKKEQCQPPIRIIITGAEEITYSPRRGEDAETKVVIDFEAENTEKFRLSLNDANLDWLAIRFGEETSNWLSKMVGLKHDPAVKFNNEVVGGFRLIPAEEVPRKPTLVRRTQPAPAQVAASVNGDEIPF
jgi:hypothetical protein